MADLKKTFSKRDTSDWSYKLNEVTEIIKDTIPSYHIGVIGKANSSQSKQLPQMYNKAWLKKTKLSMKEIISLMKKLSIPMGS